MTTTTMALEAIHPKLSHSIDMSALIEQAKTRREAEELNKEVIANLEALLGSENKLAMDAQMRTLAARRLQAEKHIRIIYELIGTAADNGDDCLTYRFHINSGHEEMEHWIHSALMSSLYAVKISKPSVDPRQICVWVGWGTGGTPEDKKPDILKPVSAGWFVELGDGKKYKVKEIHTTPSGYQVTTTGNRPFSMHIGIHNKSYQQLHTTKYHVNHKLDGSVDGVENRHMLPNVCGVNERIDYEIGRVVAVYPPEIKPELVEVKGTLWMDAFLSVFFVISAGITAVGFHERSPWFVLPYVVSTMLLMVFLANRTWTTGSGMWVLLLLSCSALGILGLMMGSLAVAVIGLAAFVALVLFGLSLND